ncbi:MAG: hypothetical protein WBO19_07535, partial [Terriglobia bacterium]
MAANPRHVGEVLGSCPRACSAHGFLGEFGKLVFVARLLVGGSLNPNSDIQNRKLVQASRRHGGC